MPLHEQDGASLVRAVVSKEAKVFRFQLCKIIADILYQWVFEALGQGMPARQYSYQSLLRDRRLKVIFFKILKSARREPVLMLRFYWALFVMFIAASALAFRRLLVSLSEAYLGPLSFAPKRFAISAWNFSWILQRAYPCST